MACCRSLLLRRCVQLIHNNTGNPSYNSMWIVLNVNHYRLKTHRQNYRRAAWDNVWSSRSRLTDGYTVTSTLWLLLHDSHGSFVTHDVDAIVESISESNRDSILMASLYVILAVSYVTYTGKYLHPITVVHPPIDVNVNAHPKLCSSHCVCAVLVVYSHTANTPLEHWYTINSVYVLLSVEMGWQRKLVGICRS